MKRSMGVVALTAALPLMAVWLSPIAPGAAVRAEEIVPSNRVYVTDSTGNRIVPIQFGASTPGTAIAMRTGSSGPTGIALTRDGRTAYVTDSGSDSLHPLTLSSGVFGNPIGVNSPTRPANPQYLAISPDSTQAYVANEDADTVTPVNLGTDQPGIPISLGADTGPVAVAFTPDGATAYVANYQAGTVSPITVATRQVGTPIEVGDAPAGLAVSPDGTTIYVANQASGTVTPIDVATNTTRAAIGVGSAAGPSAIAVTPDGKTAYVANFTDSTVVPIDLSGTSPTAGVPIALGANTKPAALAVTPDGSAVYVAEFAAGAVGEINTANNTVRRTIEVGGNPLGIAITPDRGPTAALRIDAAPAGSPSTLSAADSSAGSTPVARYRFEFGDGSAPVDSQSPTITHVYPTAGRYTATVTVTSAAGTSTGDFYTGQMTVRSGGETATAETTVQIDAAISAVSPSAYVANFGSGSITPITTAPTLAPGPAVNVSANPSAVAVAPDGRTAYSVSAGDGTVIPVDVATNRARAPIAVGNQPAAIAIAPDGATAYVANTGSASLSVITLATGAVSTIELTGAQPVSLAIDPSGTWIYVGDAAGRAILPVRAANGSRAIAVNIAEVPAALAVHPDGDRLYAAGSNGTVRAFSIGAAGIGGLEDDVDLGAGSGPAGVAVTPDGDYVYVTLKSADKVVRLSPGLFTDFVTDTATLPDGSAPAGVAITPNAATALVTLSGSNKVLPITVSSNNPGTAISVGNAPSGIAITPDQAPIARLSVTPGLADSPIAFNASASSAPSSAIKTWSWSFGDGSAPMNTTVATTTHVYAAPGAYTAKVTLTDTAGTSTTQVFTGQTASRNGGAAATAAQTFTVFAPAPVVSSYGPTSARTGATVTLFGEWLHFATVKIGGFGGTDTVIAPNGRSLTFKVPGSVPLNTPQNLVVTTPGPAGPQSATAAAKFTRRL